MKPLPEERLPHFCTATDQLRVDIACKCGLARRDVPSACATCINSGSLPGKWILAGHGRLSLASCNDALVSTEGHGPRRARLAGLRHLDPGRSYLAGELLRLEPHLFSRPSSGLARAVRLSAADLPIVSTVIIPAGPLCSQRTHPPMPESVNADPRLSQMSSYHPSQEPLHTLRCALELPV
jgi:hypothetical protein